MKQQNTLYHPSFEHDNCGIGAVVNVNGAQTHAVVDDACDERRNEQRGHHLNEHEHAHANAGELVVLKKSRENYHLSSIPQAASSRRSPCASAHSIESASCSRRAISLS